MIRVTVPSRLEYRDLAIRLVASACKLVPLGEEDFANQVISAFSEALNNVVIHGKAEQGGELELEIETRPDGLTIRMKDHGKSFDPCEAPAPDLDSLPESGMGTFIMRSFMDEVSYSSGKPNILSMTKYVKAFG